MTIPKLPKATYLAWAQELSRLRAPAPTMAETINAERAHVLDVTARHDGAFLRVIVQSGGSLDLNLNAAQAIHLLRSLLAAGQAGGWMDRDGNAVTEPRTEPYEDPQPVPRDDPR